MRDNSSSNFLDSSARRSSDLVGSTNLFRSLTEISSPIFSPLGEESVAVKGIGSVLDESNKYVFPILRAESTTISVTNQEASDEIDPISSVSGE